MLIILLKLDKRRDLKEEKIIKIQNPIQKFT